MGSPPCDNRIMHDWLVRLLLEVTVPARPELLAWPAVHLFKLFLSRSDLDTGIDAVCSQRASPVGIPLLKDLLLNFRNATNEVVERIDMRLGSVGREGKIVVLKVKTNTGQVDLAFDTSCLKLLWITCKMLVGAYLNQSHVISPMPER